MNACERDSQERASFQHFTLFPSNLVVHFQGDGPFRKPHRICEVQLSAELCRDRASQLRVIICQFSLPPFRLLGSILNFRGNSTIYFEHCQ